MAFFIGYGAAGIAPLIVGALRDAARSFQIAFALLAAAAVLIVGPIARLAPHQPDPTPQPAPRECERLGEVRAAGSSPGSASRCAVYNALGADRFLIGLEPRTTTPKGQRSGRTGNGP